MGVGVGEGEGEGEGDDCNCDDCHCGDDRRIPTAMAQSPRWSSVLPCASCWTAGRCIWIGTVRARVGVGGRSGLGLGSGQG